MYLDPLALAISVLVIVGIFALAGGFALIVRGNSVVARRLAEPLPEQFMPAHALEVQPGRTRWLARVLEPIAKVARPVQVDEVERLSQRLQQAGIRSPHASAIYLATKVVLAVSSVTAFLWQNSQRSARIEPAFLVSVVAFAAGFYAPDAWLSSRTKSRQTSIERGLPDALDLLVTCVESGLGLDASLQRVSDEIRIAWPILAGELQTTFLEIKAGIPRVESFRRMASRTGVRELKSLSATLTQTETFGTSVALALRVQAEGIRVRRMQRAEERAAYVAVKMSLPLVLCILPSLLTIVIGPAIIRVAANLLPMLGGGR